MKKKVVIFILLIVLLIICVFITKNVFNNNSVNNKNIFSYNDYQNIFIKILDNCDIKGYEIKGSTKGGNLTIVDQDLTFNKRKFLCISPEDIKINEQNQFVTNNEIKPTQEFLVLENKQQNSQILIGIFYTPTYIGDDMIGFINNNGFDLNYNNIDKTNLSILSYKNLILSILCTNENEPNIHNLAVRNLIKILEN